MIEAEQIQLKTSTAPNRYPKIFAAAELASREICPRRILSFGCSKGEETASLADLYFDRPDDGIVGVDIHPRAIAHAKANNARDRVQYFLSTDPAFAEVGGFDVIFAMSVLCNWPATKDAANANDLFPFARFDQLVGALDDRLNVGGLLIVHNANYAFADTEAALRYQHAPAGDGRGFVHMFNPDGSRMPKAIPHNMFRKLA